MRVETRIITILLMSVISLTSCSIARFQPVQRDSIYVARVDSVMLYDSIYIDRIRTIKEKADTVYITDVKTEYKYRYRDRVKVDTLVVEKLVTQIEEVEKELTKLQKVQIKCFWWFVGSLVAWIVWKSRKLWLHL